MTRLALIFALLLVWPGLAAAQEPATLQPGASSLTVTGRGKLLGWGGPPPMELRLTLTRAVPYRVYLVGDPIRLIVDLQGVDFAGSRPDDLFGADLVPAIRWGHYRRGWSRVVIELPGPYRVQSAGQRTTAPQPQITIALHPVDEADFAPGPVPRPPCATCRRRPNLRPPRRRRSWSSRWTRAMAGSTPARRRAAQARRIWSCPSPTICARRCRPAASRWR